MLKTFTPNDLLLFYYKETNPEETLMIKNSLVEDEELKDDYLEMRKVIGYLNTAKCNGPSKTSIDIIMEHSRNNRCN